MNAPDQMVSLSAARRMVDEAVDAALAMAEKIAREKFREGAPSPFNWACRQIADDIAALRTTEAQS